MPGGGTRGWSHLVRASRRWSPTGRRMLVKKNLLHRPSSARMQTMNVPSELAPAALVPLETLRTLAHQIRITENHHLAVGHLRNLVDAHLSGQFEICCFSAFGIFMPRGHSTFDACADSA